MAEDASKSIKKNYIFNVIYQVVLIIVPLVVTPYISRVLSPEGIGQYSFSFSLITYFTIFAALGFGTYAQREIAKHQGDKHTQSISFYEILICRLISVSLSLVLNVIFYFLNIYHEYSTLMLIMSINIFAIAFDISFYFQGNEEFGKVVFLNIVVRVLGTAAIFIFVNNSNDVWKYALINGIMILTGYLSLWIHVPKFIEKISLRELHPLKHLKGTLLLFLPTIAISLYTVLDRTLIGLLIKDTYTYVENDIEIIKKYSDIENGYYEQSEKMVKLAMTIITCIGTVMIPRNSKEFAAGNLEQVKNNIYFSIRLVWFLGAPMTLGLIAVAGNFVPWFYGSGYDKCITLIMIFSPLILIIGFSNIFGLQFLIPSGQDKKYTIALIIGALVNLVLNFVLIKLWWSIGAAIASIIAEFCVTSVMYLFVRKDIKLMKIIQIGWRYVIAGIMMFLAVYFTAFYFSSSILNTILLVLIGLSLYVVILLILRDPMIIKVFSTLGKKIKTKK